MNQPEVLSLVNISKSFPGAQALSGVHFSLKSGEIHSLMGQNGAGKSTLIKIITGVHQPDAGTIRLKNTPIRVESPKHAQELGIATVYQEVNLCPNLTVAENLLLGREPKRIFGIHWKALNRDAETILREKLNLSINPEEALGTYPLAIQQMVAIGRALCIKADILILDEPTSSLDDTEVQRLFTILRKLKQDGLSILFITHFIDQVFEISDRVTVLRNGEWIDTVEIQKLTRLDLIKMMVGKETLEVSPSFRKDEMQQSAEKKEVLRAEGLGRPGYLHPVTLSIKKGEIVGFAGLLGSGRTETAKLLFAAERAYEGTLYKEDKQVTPTSPLDAIRLGMGFSPEDRKTEGLIGDLTVRENIILALQANRGVLKYLPRKLQEEIANRFIQELEIKTPTPEAPVKTLSGGNQQKVLLARWLATNSSILIFDEPTRGIDVATKAEILRRISQLREQGMSIIFISSELEEIVGISDRVAVFRDKKKIAELESEEIDNHRIMSLIAQEEQKDENLSPPA